MTIAAFQRLAVSDIVMSVEPSPVAAFTGIAPKPAVTSLAGFAPVESVVTSLAGFDGGLRPQPRGGRTGMPAAFRYPAAVSRRTPVACSMRRTGQPSWPSAMTCFRFSSLKTLLTPTEAIASRLSYCPEHCLRWPIFR